MAHSTLRGDLEMELEEVGNPRLLRLQLGRLKEKRQRLPLLLALADALLQSEPEGSLEAATEAVSIALELRRPELSEAYRQLAHARFALDDMDLGFRQLWKSLETATAGVERGDIALEIGRIRSQQGEHAEGLEFYRAALEEFRKEEEEVGECLALKGLGDLYSGISDLQHALDHYLQALRVAETIAEQGGEKELQGVLLSDVGLIYIELKEYDLALTYLDRSREVFATSGLPHLEVRSLVNLANVQTSLGNFPLALEHALRGLAIYDTLGDPAGLAATLSNLARIYEGLNEQTLALECCGRALDLFDALGDEIGHCNMLLTSGMLYHGLEQYQNAIFVLEQGLEQARETGASDLEYRCRNYLALSLEATGDTLRSLRHLRECLRIREQLVGEERLKGIAELQAQYDLERSEKEREIYRLRSERLEQENRYKTAELTSLSMRLVEKNRFMNDIRLAIEKIQEGSSEELQPLVRDILRKIRNNVASSTDWNAFEEQFQKVHHDFTARLTRRFPSLTKSEIRVCTLIRTGLSSSEIASLFHVTKRNIDTHRYRLRKKLGIGQEIDLSRFLSEL